jgi:hypothetical protein
VIAIEEPGQPKKNEVEFNFENESLKHKYGSTMRKNMFEVSCRFLLSLAMDQSSAWEQT